MFNRFEDHINTIGPAALCRGLGLFETVRIPRWILHLGYLTLLHTLAAEIAGTPTAGAIFAEVLKSLP